MRLTKEARQQYIASDIKRSRIMRLSTVLRDARKRSGLSLREVERRTGVSNGYLSLIESGQVRQPSPKHLAALAEAFGVSYSLLMELAGHVAPTTALPDAGELPDEFGDLSAVEREQVRAFAGFLRASRTQAPNERREGPGPSSTAT